VVLPLLLWGNSVLHLLARHQLWGYHHKLQALPNLDLQELLQRRLSHLLLVLLPLQVVLPNLDLQELLQRCLSQLVLVLLPLQVLLNSVLLELLTQSSPQDFRLHKQHHPIPQILPSSDFRHKVATLKQPIWPLQALLFLQVHRSLVLQQIHLNLALLDFHLFRRWVLLLSSANQECHLAMISLHLLVEG
jgi:hypothetical protein